VAKLDRAVAVVVRNHQVLVVGRCRDGVSYAVLPGGGIEAGETAETAVARELQEETGLAGRIADLLWVRDDGGRRATYFWVDDVGGTPVLGGPERERSSSDNQYVLRWVGVEDLADLDLRPTEVAPLIRELLTSIRT
jgi:8-oxo-dGTP pyrophosphatase MutT (NUDIX family)